MMDESNNLDFDVKISEPKPLLDEMPVRIEINETLLHELRKFSTRDFTKELGAVLLGSYNRLDNCHRVTVEAWIEAKYADNQNTNITFTHDTWDYIAKEQERAFPELIIIGWFHTHPGFGIFLSSYDLFIHENFFTSPWQIAMVIDPKAEKTGFFSWQNGKVQPANYNIFKDSTVTIDTKKGFASLQRRKTVASLVGASFIVGFLGAMILNLLFWQQAGIPEDYEILRQSQADHQAVIENLQHELEIMTAERDHALTMIPPVLPDPIHIWIATKILPGDTLFSLFERFGIHRNQLQRVMEKNSLSSKDLIINGDILLLPVSLEKIEDMR